MLSEPVLLSFYGGFVTWAWVFIAQLCLTLCNPLDYSPPGPLYMEFSRQEYWSGLPFPLPGNLPGSLLCLLHWQKVCLPLSNPESHYMGRGLKPLAPGDWFPSSPSSLSRAQGAVTEVPSILIMRLFLWQPVPTLRCGPKVTSLAQQYTLLRKLWTEGFQELFSRN